MAKVFNYQDGEYLCVVECPGGTDFAENPQSGIIGNQLFICCTDTDPQYAVDPNTGFLFPVCCTD